MRVRYHLARRGHREQSLCSTLTSLLCMRLHSARYWRTHAEEARSLAESTRSIEGRNAMLVIADQYEELACRSECFARHFPDITWRDDKPV
jgi:hypothetical protein